MLLIKGVRELNMISIIWVLFCTADKNITKIYNTSILTNKYDRIQTICN
jgi:hypothetical protein